MEKVKNDRKKTTWGGKRKNAGAKLKYGEKTKLKSLRVPVSKESEVMGFIKEKLRTYLVK